MLHKFIDVVYSLYHFSIVIKWNVENVEKGRWLKKTRSISFQEIADHSEPDLTRLKKKAEEEGMPYQTLISSVLHKYITERLVNEKEVLKSLQFLAKR